MNLKYNVLDVQNGHDVENASLTSLASRVSPFSKMLRNVPQQFIPAVYRYPDPKKPIFDPAGHSAYLNLRSLSQPLILASIYYEAAPLTARRWKALRPAGSKIGVLGSGHPYTVGINCWYTYLHISKKGDTLVYIHST